MSSHLTNYEGVPVGKLNFKKQKGFLEIKLFDWDHTLIYKNKINISKKKELAELKSDLKHKGFNLFDETSWF